MFYIWYLIREQWWYCGIAQSCGDNIAYCVVVQLWHKSIAINANWYIRYCMFGAHMSNSGDPSPGCHINDPIPTSQVILLRWSSIYSISQIGKKWIWALFILYHLIFSPAIIEISSLNVSSKYNLIISKKNWKLIIGIFFDHFLSWFANQHHIH